MRSGATYRLVVALGVWLVLLASPAWARTEVRVGVLAYQGEAAAEHDWAPLARALDQALPQHHFELRYLGLNALWQAVEHRQLDFVITHGGQYAAMESQLGASRIATLDNPRWPSPGRAVGSAVVVLAARHDLQRLDDLAGQRLAATDPQAFGGYLVALRELHQRGIEADDLSLTEFSGFPMERVLDRLETGRADAAVLRGCLLEELVRSGRIAPGRFRVLEPQSFERTGGYPCQVSTQLYPDWPFISLRHTDRALAKSVAAALLALRPLPDGPSWTVPADYQPVRDLYRELEVGPYAYLRDTTLMARLRGYWWIFLALSVGLVGWVIHTVRVESQVTARTRDLQRALTERDAAHERLLAQQEEASHLSRLSILGELSGTLAHELTQPLASMANFAHSMVRRLDSGRYTPELLLQASRDIASEAERAGAIVQRIRRFARKRGAVRQDGVPPEMVQDALELFVRVLAPAPRIEVRDSWPTGSTISCDPLQFQQVMLNLLKNAWDAMQALPAHQRLIEIEIGRQPAHCTISVRDHGCGQDDAGMARLFEPFFTTRPDGLGLGLSICRTIVEAHAGRLVAQRPQDGGAGLCFIATFPAHD
ncbi:sensor histidine kinase [Amphibiibacter pelophylacis]|uniref:PhnD/SsuA/transferrin family substrate-binding protein n=1 Tax=Amphibiibacter pelophylacis TaxID=1799477 RepID=A0ACC6NY95_9BURK